MAEVYSTETFFCLLYIAKKRKNIDECTFRAMGGILNNMISGTRNLCSVNNTIVAAWTIKFTSRHVLRSDDEERKICQQTCKDSHWCENICRVNLNVNAPSNNELTLYSDRSWLESFNSRFYYAWAFVDVLNSSVLSITSFFTFFDYFFLLSYLFLT